MLEEKAPNFKVSTLQISDNGSLIDSRTITFCNMCDMYYAYGLFTGKVEIRLLNGGVRRVINETNKRIVGISFDSTSKYVLVAGNDTKVLLTEVENESVKKVHMHGSCITACCIDPNCEKSSGGEISCVIVDDANKVFRIAPKKSLFGANSPNEKQIVQEPELISSIEWKEDIIIWATSKQIIVYNSKTETFIRKVDIIRSRCLQEATLRVSYVTISSQKSWTLVNGTIVEVSHINDAVNYVSEKENVAVAYKDDQGIIKLMFDDYQNILMNKENKIFLDITTKDERIIEYLPTLDSYFNPKAFVSIFRSPNSIYVSTNSAIFVLEPYKPHEIISYYIEKDNIDTALAKFRKFYNDSQAEEKQKLAFVITGKLISLGKESEAASFAIESNCNHEQIIDLFREKNVLKSLIPLIKIEKIKLGTKEMTAFLEDLLTFDPKRLAEELKILSVEQYNSEYLIDKVKVLLPTNPSYRSTLMTLYFKNDKNIKYGLELALEDHCPEIFVYISNHKEYKFVINKSIELFSVFGGEFINYLLEQINNIPPQEILVIIDSEIKKQSKIQNLNNEELSKPEQFKLLYLDELFKGEFPLEEVYGTDLVVLYLKSNHPNTLSFLQNSVDFDYNIARQVALKYKRKPAAAYLCKKTGAPIDGMKIFLVDSNDPNDDPIDAINFANAVDDKKVWKMLVDYSYTHKPYLMRIMELLPVLHLNPIKYIKGIPESVPISEYEKIADKTVKEYKRKLTTSELTHDIVSKDAFGAFSRSFNRFRKGKPINMNE